jgi:hypothetical protein
MCLPSSLFSAKRTAKNSDRLAVIFWRLRPEGAGFPPEIWSCWL